MHLVTEQAVLRKFGNFAHVYGLRSGVDFRSFRTGCGGLAGSLGFPGVICRTGLADHLNLLADVGPHIFTPGERVDGGGLRVGECVIAFLE